MPEYPPMNSFTRVCSNRLITSYLEMAYDNDALCALVYSYVEACARGAAQYYIYNKRLLPSVAHRQLVWRLMRYIPTMFPKRYQSKSQRGCRVRGRVFPVNKWSTVDCALDNLTLLNFKRPSRAHYRCLMCGSRDRTDGCWAAIFYSFTCVPCCGGKEVVELSRELPAPAIREPMTMPSLALRSCGRRSAPPPNREVGDEKRDGESNAGEHRWREAIIFRRSARASWGEPGLYQPMKATTRLP